MFLVWRDVDMHKMHMHKHLCEEKYRAAKISGERKKEEFFGLSG